MITPLAQSSPDTLLAVAIVTLLSLPVGIAIGYFWAYRYKRQYLRVATELANLRGQNFRGQISTIGIPQGAAPGRSMAPAPDSQELVEARRQLSEIAGERDSLLAEVEAMRQRMDPLQQQYDELLAEREAAVADTVPSPSVGGTGGTEAWQLAQLHREQIAMQIRLDDLLAQTAQLTRERDSYAARLAELEGTASS